MAGVAQRLVRGSPASAGIDPKAALPRPSALRLPRVRGDRPLGVLAAGGAVYYFKFRGDRNKTGSRANPDDYDDYDEETPEEDAPEADMPETEDAEPPAPEPENADGDL